MWTPSDILTDLDLLAIDRLCLTDFGVTQLADKRRVAVDWAAQRVQQAGYVLQNHLTRKAAEFVLADIAGTETDYTAEALDTTEDDVPLVDIFAKPSSCALYVGHQAPFKGVYVGLIDAVNAQACVLTAKVWAGGWTAVTSQVDGTIASTGKTCSGGGLVSWQQPDAWAKRIMGNSLLYWAKFTVSSSMTAGTAAGQLTPVVTTRLTLPCAYYTLGLLYQESYGSQRGQWQEKAEAFFAKADNELQVALPLIADEFDVDEDQAVSATEASSVTASVGGYAHWERG